MCRAESREAPQASQAPAAAGAAGGGGAQQQWAFASSVSRRVNLDLALAEAAEGALKVCGESEPDIVFVFASSAYGRALDLLVPLLRRLLPTARCIVGCTGFGVCGTAVGGGQPEEVEHAPAVALALAALPGVEMEVVHVQAADVPDGDAAPDEWARLVRLPLEGSSGDGGGSSGGGGDPVNTNFIVISDPTFDRIEELLAGLDFAFPAAKKIGGLASSGRLSSTRSIFCWSADQEAADAESSCVKHSGAAVLALRGPLSMELLIAQGCRPLSSHTYSVSALSPDQRNLILAVTDSSSGVSFKPIDALRRDLGEPLQPINSERELAHVVSNLCCGLAPADDVFGPAPGSAAPEAVAEARGAGGGAEAGCTTQYLIRGMAVTSSGGLLIGDTLRVAQTFRFMVRDREGAQADLTAHGLAYKRRQLAATLAGRSEPPAIGALMFSCNGRGSGLYGEESYDSRQVSSYVGVPVCGFQCNGEIGSVGGSTKLHGFTAAVAVLRALGSSGSSSGSGEGNTVS